MPELTIAAAQVPSVRGDVLLNAGTHAAAIRAAASAGVSALVFPELSLTGYELDLLEALALSEADARLTPLRELVQECAITAVVGVPVRTANGAISIGAFVLMPDGNLRTYLKMHLGTNEARYVSAGMMPMTLDFGEQRVGLAICADTSRPSHLETYVGLGATTYAAGVFLNNEWYTTDSSRFPAYATRYHVLALMANHGASTGTLVSVGKSAAWAPGGQLLAQAPGTESCLVAATCSDGAWRGRLVSV